MDDLHNWNVPQFQRVSGFDGTGNLFVFNNHTATTNKKKDKAGCPGHVGDPVEVDDGAKLLSFPLFALSGEMGLKFTLYYHSETGSAEDVFDPWASSIDYVLDTDCAVTGTSSSCDRVTLYRPDGSSLSFSGNYGSYGNFPEIGGGGLATLTHNSDGTWTLHDSDVTVQTYNSAGHLTSIKDASGIGWTISSSTTNDSGVTQTATTVTHTDGQSFTIESLGTHTTTSANRQVTVTDPAGNQYTYLEQGYKGSNGIWVFNVDSISLPGTPATKISFTLGGDLVTAVAYNGTAYWTTNYDDDRVGNDGAADGTEQTSIAYSFTSGGMVAAITNPLGLTTTNTYTKDSQGNYLLASVSNSAVLGCGSTTNTLAWDGNDNLTKTVDNDGVTTTYDYAANGQLQTRTEAYGTAVARTTNFVWDSDAQLNRLLSVTVPGESRTSYTYNAQNRLASVTRTNLTGIGTANQSLTTTYAYTLYSDGMVETMTITQPSPNGSDHTTYAYDTHGNLTSVTDSLGYVTSYSNYNGLGEVGKVVGPNGDETDYTYDARGRTASKTTHPNGTTATWTYAYDGFGLLSQVNAPDGEVTTWTRDAEKRVKTISHNDMNGTSTETFAYDAAGNVTSDVIARGSDIGKETTYVYNALGKVYQVKGSHGQVLTYAYDGNGNVLSVTNALNDKTSYAYDALDRVVDVTNAAGGVTAYAYDAADHVTRITDPRGLVTSYAWDGLGQLWQQVSPDTGTTTFSYDTSGRLASKTRADGTTITYAYDAENRLVSKTAAGVTRTYTWDTCTNGRARFCAAGVSGTDNVAYSYSPEGWITGRSFSFSGGPTYTLGYAYDNMGHLATVDYPDGNEALYDYTDGAVSDVRFQVGANSVYGVTDITYRPMDLAMSSWTSVNGLTNTIAYDSDLRPTSITVPGIESLAFSYDAADRIVQLNNGIDGNMSASLGYDAMNRLTAYSSPSGDESYAYDADGNRTYQVLNGSATSFSYPSTSNRLASMSGGLNATWGYGADGNLATLNGLTAYLYGPFNHLINASGVDYVFDAEGQRLEKTGASGTTYFAPDPGGDLLAEDQNGTWFDYVYLNGRLVSEIVGGGTFPVHDDQTGRPMVVTDGGSKTFVRWSAQNYPFNRTVTVQKLGQFNLGFPGQYNDLESGLWHNGARDYDASLGRYIESDPAGLAAGVNTYVYADNDPITNVDPLGLRCTLAQSILSKIENGLVNFFAGHMNQTLTFDAGAGFGAEGSLTIEEENNGIAISGRFGLGLGIGFGASATANYTAGHPEGFGVLLSNTGGVGGAYQASVSGGQGGAAASVGAGIGLGEGATATVGYDGNIANLNFGGSGSCGCH